MNNRDKAYRYINTLKRIGYKADLHPKTRSAFLSGDYDTPIGILIAYGYDVNTSVFWSIKSRIDHTLFRDDRDELSTQYFTDIFSKETPNKYSMYTTIEVDQYPDDPNIPRVVFYLLTGPCDDFGQHYKKVPETFVIVKPIRKTPSKSKGEV